MQRREPLRAPRGPVSGCAEPPAHEAPPPCPAVPPPLAAPGGRPCPQPALRRERGSAGSAAGTAVPRDA